MNIQPGRMKHSPKGSSARQNPEFGRQFGRMMRMIGILLLAAGVFVLHIYLNQRVAETEREIRSVKLNIRRVSAEMTNLRNRYEERCSPDYIYRQIARFKLDLIPAEPSQMYSMSILPPGQVRNIAIRMESRRKMLSMNKPLRKEQ